MSKKKSPEERVDSQVVSCRLSKVHREMLACVQANDPRMNARALLSKMIEMAHSKLPEASRRNASKQALLNHLAEILTEEQLRMLIAERERGVV